MSSASRSLAVGALLALAACASCGARYIEGLALGLPDGGVVRVSREDKASRRDEPRTLVLGGSEARLAFESEAVLSPGHDLVLRLERRAPGGGAVSLLVSASEGGASPRVIHESLALPEASRLELRLPLSGGFRLASITLAPSVGLDLDLEALAIEPSLVGLRRVGERLIVDAATARSLADSGGRAAQLASGSVLDVSIALAGSGTLRIAPGGGGRGYRTQTPSAGHVAVPLEFLGATVSVEAEGGLTEAFLVPGKGAPLADLHALLRLEPVGGDGYRVYRWDALPDTLVFIFDTYAVQDRFLKRLAFYTEKPGFRGRVAEDAEIAALHGWNAHDYSTETLAAFYNAAPEGRLNRDELRLRDILEAQGLLRRSGSRLESGGGAIISIALETAPSLRRVFMDHEASHAIFFQDPDYRELSARLWDGLSPEARRFWRLHLAWRNYDIEDRYLCVNELQAYLVQQGTSRTRTYYETLATRLATAYPERAEAVMADAAYAIAEAERDALVLDAYLRERYGLAAGRMGRLVLER